MIIYKTAVTLKIIHIILRQNRLNCKSMVNDSLQNDGNSEDYKHYFKIES